MRPSLLSPALHPFRTLPHFARTFSSSPASALARIQIIGRLAAPPELTPTASGTEIVKYAVGTSYGRGDERKTSWFKIASFLGEGGSRDFLLGLQKGTLVHVEGDASMRSYEDKDGVTRHAVNIAQRMYCPMLTWLGRGGL